jgi:hypothetical protein
MMETLSEMGIKQIVGTYNKKLGVEVKAIELRDAILIKRTIERVEFIPKGDSNGNSD